MGIFSYVIHNYGIYLSTLGITWGYVLMLFTTLGFTWGKFPWYSQSWELHGEMFPRYLQFWNLLEKYSHGIHNFGNYLRKFFHFIHNFGRNIAKYSHIIPHFWIKLWKKSQHFFNDGIPRTAKPFPSEKPIYEVLRVDNFPKVSQKRNFMFQIFPNNGEIPHLIPKWES